MRSFAAIAVAIVSAALPSCAASGQRVLTEVQEGQRHNSHEFHVRQQSPHLCDAGSRFWTGTVNVTDNKSMFFWYFESRFKPKTDPLVLWMSGGPGATGELGLFMGSGPCAVNEDGNSTRRLQYSWIDRANVVYIDQPVGVGFSEISDRDDIAVNLHSGARDVYAFLSILSTDVFPQLADRPWHITGESMAGHYVTGYTRYIASLEQDRIVRGLKPQINISSAVIVDGYVDASRQTVGYYEFFCTDWAADGRMAPLLNDTACASMAAAVPNCEFLGAQCRTSYNIENCKTSANICDETVGKYFLAGVQPGGWDPYDGRHRCEEPPLCSNFNHGATWEYFNQPWVQEMLGFRNLSFELIDFDTNRRWAEDGSLYLPTTQELNWILDQTDIKVLFFNGNNDIIINTPGQMRMLDEQPWKGQAQYRSLAYEEWRFRDGEVVTEDNVVNSRRGGFWKGTDRLRLYTVDEAGHFAPYHQPEAIGAVLRSWLREF